MDQLYGIGLYVISLLTFGGIYAVMTLGLNVQWGFTGMFNAGIAGFFAIGAYTSAMLTTAASERHLGGLDLPFVVGFIAAMIAGRYRCLCCRPHLHPAPQRLSGDRDPRHR